MQHRPWNTAPLLSRGLAEIEHIVEGGRFETAAWSAVAYAGGIAAWFALSGPPQWLAFAAAMLGLACAALAAFPADGPHPRLRRTLVLLALLAVAGTLTVWGRSELAGQEPIPAPRVSELTGTVLSSEEQPALDRTRLTLAVRLASDERPLRVRLNLPAGLETERLAPGAVVRLRARLVPPAPPMLPGGYDFARNAWFRGLAATGSVIEIHEVLRPAPTGGGLAAARSALSRHIRKRLSGSEAGIASALATGDHGGIAESDAQAMRDAGLAHLLSISGLHVSAVIAATYFVFMRILAAIPWLALRVRLPVLAACGGALAGIGYTLLTGAEVPTVRSCIGALLVLAAVALGREALSLRLLAIAAFAVLLLWPESLIGPSFQMSFAAVLALIALATCEPVQRFLAPRDEAWALGIVRKVAMLFLTGVVIELSLMPIGLFHFHRAGAYGAAANVLAIPLTTFAVMPLVASALVLDLAGAGAPLWWLAGKAIGLLLGIAHWIAAQPGSVTTLPAMGGGTFTLFVIGGLWLALWRGWVRLAGLAPAAVGIVLLAGLRPPDLLISGDGRQVALVNPGRAGLLVLRTTRSSYVRDNLNEAAGMSGEPHPFETLPGAQCTPDFCTVLIERGERRWTLLVSRSREYISERALAAACERADIVVSSRWLPYSCRPRWIKADGRMLSRTGGMTIDLPAGKITTVAEGQGRHGWWQPGPP